MSGTSPSPPIAGAGMTTPAASLDELPRSTPLNEHAEGMNISAGPSATQPVPSGAASGAAMVLLDRLRDATNLGDSHSGLDPNFADVVRREAAEVLRADAAWRDLSAPDRTDITAGPRPTQSLTEAERAAVDLVRALLRPASDTDLPDLNESMRVHHDDRTMRNVVALVVDAQLERMAEVVTNLGLGSIADAGPERRTADRSTASTETPDAALVCPRCGHALSQFMEPTVTRANRAAGRVADAMGSWRFIVALCIVTVGYVVVALSIQPSNTETAIAMNYLGIGMTIFVGIQTPLILLTQRRDAARDRAREQEALRVATRAEHDLHAIREALDGQRGS